MYAGRQQALADQRAAEEEAAAEVERARLRQQDAFSLLVKQAVRSGATAGEIGLYRRLAAANFSRISADPTMFCFLPALVVLPAMPCPAQV